MDTSLITNQKNSKNSGYFTMKKLVIGFMAVTMVVAVLGYVSTGVVDTPIEAELMTPDVASTTLVQEKNIQDFIDTDQHNSKGLNLVQTTT